MNASSRAKNILYCSLKVEECNRIYICKMQKKFHVILRSHMTSQAKEYKINLVVHKYELIKMDVMKLFLKCLLA